MEPVVLPKTSLLFNRFTLAALLLAGLVYGGLWYFHAPAVPAGVTTAAQTAPELKRDAAAPLKLGSIQAHAPRAKRTLQLPAAVQADADQHVIAASRTANDERQHTITTLVDAQTGEVTSYDRVEPLPWVTVNTKSEVGVFYGIKSGSPVLRLQGRQDLLQLKAMHVGVVGTLDSDATFFVGIGASARW